MNTNEVLRLALEALEYIDLMDNDRDFLQPHECYMLDEAIVALREALAEQPAQQEPEFITHIVEQSYDWSEWVCPDPKGYLMKCCDCGLVHEAEFGVVRYKSETEREDCDKVDDPTLQAVFRMRRSEKWSPKDTAHRAGGLPMEQPAQQEPVKLPCCGYTDASVIKWNPYNQVVQCHNCGQVYTFPPPQRKPLTTQEIREWWASENGLEDCAMSKLNDFEQVVRAVEAKHNIKEQP